ncbi:MAG TPA: GNAT family N-acetyltransferase [Planctomycetota bacterium]|nr:GNAT family N-acetyltransferase [Planctomycetota bacterium]
MYQSLGDARLKTGESVEIGVFTSPVAAPFADQLNRLLGHKGWEWVWQIGRSVKGETDELENRFYAARRGDEILSNVSTFEAGGVGILGHVWTPPEERRKGLCTAIFEVLMEDYRSRGGGLMLLGTGYNSPPYHIYRRFGFVGYYEGSGLMRYSTEDDFERRYFAAGETKVVGPTWAAWPKLNALFAEPEEFTKSIHYGRFYRQCAEDLYLWLLHAMGEGESICLKLLESEATGAVVGCAWTAPDRRFPGVHLLDLYCHPNHPDGYAKLLGAMTWPAAKVTTYVEAGLETKAAALESAGFEREATLKGHLTKRHTCADVWIYSKRP